MLPTIPKLNAEVILEVFTHRSLRFPGAPINEDSEYGDNERLAILGEKVLETAVTDALFRKKPMLKGLDIEVLTAVCSYSLALTHFVLQKQRTEILSSNNKERWITAYKLRDKLRCSPDAVPNLHNPEVRVFEFLQCHKLMPWQEVSLLFHSYVGAVYATQGMTAVQNWIGALVDPDYVPVASQDVDMDPLHSAKKFKVEPFSPGQGSTPEPSMPPPPPPAGPPPPLPMPPTMAMPPTVATMAMPNPLAPAQPHTAFLPLFNQTANQRRMFVEYPATFSGPAHAGKWTVKCVGK